MTEQRRRLEKALRGCAEAGVPDSVDLWPAVRERATGERVRAESVVEERAGGRTGRHRPASQLVPNTPLGWVLAAVSVLIVGVGVYAAAGPIRELYRQGTPGAVEPGTGAHTGSDGAGEDLGVAYELFQDSVPGIKDPDVLTEIDQTRTIDDARVTVERAYADARFVAVDVRVEDLAGGQGARGRSSALQPLLINEPGGNEAGIGPHVELTDGSGQDFDLVAGGTKDAGADAVFEASEGMDPDRDHRFRLTFPLGRGMLPEGPNAGTFVFDFEVPVRPAPVIEVDQEAEAKGVTLTLQRIVNSPGRPQAVVCFDPPAGDGYEYSPQVERAGFGTPRVTGDGVNLNEPPGVVDLEGNCWSLTLGDPLKGRSSVTVPYLNYMEGVPWKGKGEVSVKRLDGPWTFEFEVPDR